MFKLHLKISCTCVPIKRKFVRGMMNVVIAKFSIGCLQPLRLHTAGKVKYLFVYEVKSLVSSVSL